jgi:cellulose 1,4-beta-cellobiosidase
LSSARGKGEPIGFTTRFPLQRLPEPFATHSLSIQIMLTTGLIMLVGAAVASANPFDNGANYYVNPSYKELLQRSIDTAQPGTVRDTLISMGNVPSAYWIDVKRKIRGNTTDTLEGILKDAASFPNPPLNVFMVYDLPNRDCNALASNGEICCAYNADGRCNYDASGDCANGLREYKEQYIDQFATVLAENPTVPVVLIIEPDSLPNLVTNINNPRCQNSQIAYKEGIKYAIDTFSARAPQATMYIDGAHGGWLGWDNNAQGFATLISQLNVHTKVRGFATNVANYQPMGVQCKPGVDCKRNPPSPADPCCMDPDGLLDEWNLANNEPNYVQILSNYMNARMPGFNPKFVIDTGRNGNPGTRSSNSNWCNIRGAGIGLKPTLQTADPSRIDAYYWLKTPGESDGCSRTLPSDADPYQPGNMCPRYDEFCGSVDSLGSRAGEPYVPEAGQWFDYQIKELAANADMGN